MNILISLKLMALVLFSSQLYAQDLVTTDLLQESIDQNISNSVDEKIEAAEVTKLQVHLKMPFVLDQQQKCIYHVQSSSQLFRLNENIDKYNDLINEVLKSCYKNFDLKTSQKMIPKTWTFNVHVGFNLTYYRPTDVKINSSRLDVTIHDFEFIQRTSAKYYNPKNWVHFSDYFKWIDEPTNSLVITAETNKHEIILSIFHPKFLDKDHQIKQVVGVVDGVQVNQTMDLMEPFDGYNNQIGEMYLTRFENTHLQMEYTIGYGYKFNIFSKSFGELSIRPAVYVGVMTGRTLVVYVKPGEYWEFDDYVENYQFQASVVGVGAKLNYQINRFNLFVETRYNHAWMNHGFMDGTAKYNLHYVPTTFGIGITLNKKKTKKVRPTF